MPSTVLPSPPRSARQAASPPRPLQDPKEFAESIALARYNEHMLASTRQMEEAATLEQRQRSAFSQQRRQLQLSKTRENRRLMEEWQADGLRKHRENMQRQAEREKAALRFELGQRDRSIRAAKRTNTRAAADEVDGISEFEESFTGAVVDTGATLDLSRTDFGRMALDPDTHLAALAKSLPNPGVMRQETDSFMSRLHTRKAEEQQALVYRPPDCSRAATWLTAAALIAAVTPRAGGAAAQGDARAGAGAGRHRGEAPRGAPAREARQTVCGGEGSRLADGDACPRIKLSRSTLTFALGLPHLTLHNGVSHSGAPLAPSALDALIGRRSPRSCRERRRRKKSCARTERCARGSTRNGGWLTCRSAFLHPPPPPISLPPPTVIPPHRHHHATHRSAPLPP